jgi:tripartite-type tricarboxylate transporter receptor subunit TctC
VLNHLVRFAAAAALFAATPSFAQDAAAGYPNKPVRLVVPFPAGGTTDILARIIGQRLSQSLGQQIVVDNRAGAAGNIGADIVAKSPPDGYTLVMGTPGTQAINQLIYSKMPYDTVKDFANVAIVGRIPNVLAVHPSVPAKTVAELIDLAKKNPGKLNYGTPGNGSTGHLSMELFKTMAGNLDIQHVPYKGSAPMLQDLIGGQIQTTFDNLPSALPHIKGGALRALAVSTTERSPALADVPTVDETVKGYEASSWFVVAAPAGTPKPIIARLNAEVNKALAADEVKGRFAEIGAQPVGGPPEDLDRLVQSEIVKWRKVVELSGAKVD